MGHRRRKPGRLETGRHPDSPPPSSARSWLPIGFLIGLSISGMTTGLLGFFSGTMYPSPRTTLLVVFGTALAVSVGPWLPQGLLRFLTNRLLHRLRRARPSKVQHPSILTGGTSRLADHDRALLLAASSLLAALALLFVAAGLGPLRVLLWWLPANFFWNPLSLFVVDSLVIFAVQAIPGTLMGLAVVSLLGIQADRTTGRGTTLRLSAILLGSATGGAAALAWFRLELTSLVVLVGAAVPLLCAGIFALLHGDRDRAESADLVCAGSPHPTLTIPEAAPSGLGLVMGGLASWSMAWVLFALAWTRSLERGSASADAVSLLFTYTVATVVGAVVFRPRSGRSSREIALVGMRLCVGSLAGAGAIVLIGQQAGAAPTAGEWILRVGLFVQGLCMGQALPALLRSALTRFATRGMAHARMITFLLGGGMIGLLLAGLPPIDRTSGLMGGCLACLFLVIGGGVLVIYAPGAQNARHRLRVAGVFGSLVCLMILLPVGASGWTAGGRLDQYSNTNSGAAAWAGAASLATAPLSGQAESAARRTESVAQRILRGCPRGSKICVIGAADDSESPSHPTEPKSGVRIERWAEGPREGVFGGDEPLARMRRCRSKFDVVVIDSRKDVEELARTYWTLESLERLSNILAATGIAVMRVPARGLDDGHIQALLHTFREAFQNRVAWRPDGSADADRSGTWLVGLGSDPKTMPTWQQLALAELQFKPVPALTRDPDKAVLHSSERPRIP